METITYKGQTIKHTDEGYEIEENLPIIGLTVTVTDTLEQAKSYIDQNEDS